MKISRRTNLVPTQSMRTRGGVNGYLCSGFLRYYLTNSAIFINFMGNLTPSFFAIRICK